ncbi:hypothetical protein B0H14DRAFT_576283 [Mycena olivaceomarginata]|nr:hypothetical protein B0H14DRAFT_576283 [Mycena olivaceomarginata]
MCLPPPYPLLALENMFPQPLSAYCTLQFRSTILARLFLTTLPFTGLRALPPGAFADVDWSLYIPHLSPCIMSSPQIRLSNTTYNRQIVYIGPRHINNYKAGVCPERAANSRRIDCLRLRNTLWSRALVQNTRESPDAWLGFCTAMLAFGCHSLSFPRCVSKVQMCDPVRSRNVQFRIKRGWVPLFNRRHNWQARLLTAA